MFIFYNPIKNKIYCELQLIKQQTKKNLLVEQKR